MVGKDADATTTEVKSLHAPCWHPACRYVFLTLTKGKTVAKINNLRDVYIEQLKDIYSAETQLTKALPKMAKAASAPDLAKGFEEHLEQTQGHVARLEQIFEGLDEKPTGKKCKAMEGLIKEGAEAIEEEASDAARDSMLIAAAQRVEHYEIAAYGTVKAFAELLDESEAVELLDQTLQEEVETDEKLTSAAKTINAEANEEDEEEPAAPSRR